MNAAPPLDFHHRPIEVDRTVRIRNGVYTGFWGRIVGVTSRGPNQPRGKVKVRVPGKDGNPAATVELSGVSVEMIR